MDISYWAKKKFDEAIDALKLNTEKHPDNRKYLGQSG